MDEHIAFQNLPDDLLSRIFHEYANLTDFESRTSYDSGNISYRARVTLCSINSRMRMLAIAISELWTHIRLGSPPGYPPIPLIELCIARSGAFAPIHVDCYYTPIPGDRRSYAKIVDESHALSAISLLLPYIHRWKSFNMFCTNGTAQDLAFWNMENARLLEKVDVVSCCEQEINYKILAKLAKLRELRHLRWFELGADEGNSTSSRPPSVISSFQWDHLRWLCLTAKLSNGTFLQLLSVLTLVKELSVNLMVDQLPPSHVNLLPPARVHLPELLELTIRAEVGLYDVFQHVDLPGIKYFQGWLNGSSWNEGTDLVVGYRDFIVRVSASLEFGLFDLTGFYAKDLVELFSHSELFRIPAADFYIWNYNADESDTAFRVLRSLADRRPDLRRRLDHQEYCDFVNFGWRSNE